MKKISRILICLMFALLFSFSAHALSNEDWEYEYIDDEVKLTKYIGVLADAEVPKKIDDKKVTALGEFIFYERDDVRTVTIERKNVDIDENAIDSGIIVYCKSGGTVQEYCEKHGITYILIEDKLEILSAKLISASEIELKFSHSGVKLYRDSGNGFEFISNIDDTTYTDSDITAGARYGYKIITDVSESSPVYISAPSYITNLSAKVNKLDVTLSWTSSEYETYEIDCSFGKTIDAKSSPITITLPDYGTFEIRIRSIVGEVRGKWSDAVTVTAEKEPDKIIVDGDYAEIGVGQKHGISAKASDGSDIKFISTNALVAKIDEGGTVTGIKKGKAVIEITTDTGLSAEYTIKVLSAPSKISASASLSTLGSGEKAQITYSLPEKTAASVTYKSKDELIASVDENGVVTGHLVGNTKIVVKTHNNKKVKIDISVTEAPDSLTCPDNLSMGIGQVMNIGAKLPENTSSKLTYISSNEKVVKISDDGDITAIAAGECDITVTTYIETVSAKTHITVKQAPAYMNLGMTEMTLGIGETYNLSPDIGEAGTLFTYKSSNKSIAKVNKAGKITAKRTGTCVITVSTHNGLSAELTVYVKKAPTGIRLSVKTAKITLGETLLLTYSLPNNSATEVTFSSSDEAVATVDASGLVTSVSIGECDITASTYNGKSDVCHVTVMSDKYPLSITIADTRVYVDEGDTYKPTLTAVPADADTTMNWSSENTGIATVNKNGKVEGKSFGKSKITGVSTLNSEISVSYTVYVLSDKRCLVLPEQRTDLSAISANLKKINNVKNSAFLEIEQLRADNVIEQKEYNRRRKIIEQAFAMYAFPFMVKETQPYWKEANSNNGKKYFQPDIVYFGLPYISSPAANRTYNAEKALAQNYYYAEDDHYIMNQENYLNKKYVGNDCSAFVSMAIWGANSSYSQYRTYEISSSSIYETIDDDKSMRPGDIINKRAAHVVMFLYYVNEEKTQMMMIEQGGRGLYTNTVWCSIANVSAYTKSGYSIRRLVSY